MKQSEIYEWVQKIASNRLSLDEINAVVDIFVTECGLFTLVEVAENIDVFTKNYFLERKVKLGFASAIVKSISSLVSEVINPPTAVSIPPVSPNHFNTGYSSTTSSNNNSSSNYDVKVPNGSIYIEVKQRRGAVVSSGLSEVIDCDYFDNVSAIKYIIFLCIYYLILLMYILLLYVFIIRAGELRKK